MNPLWSRLRSSFAAAWLSLCLAACEPPRSAPPSNARAVDVPASFPAPSRSFSRASAPVAIAVPSPLASAPASLDADSLVALGEHDPRAALLASGKTGSGPAGRHLRGNVLQLWAQRDFAAALAYADERPAGAEREEMLARLALVLAASQPAEAADIVAKDMAPGPARDEAAISVLHRWALAAPESAARWAEAFPPGPLRDRALREVSGAAGIAP